MSGVKETYRTITDSEYNRLLQQAREAANLAQYNDILARLQEEDRRRLQEYEVRVAAMANDAEALRRRLAQEHADNDARQQELRRRLAQVQADADAAVQREAEERQRSVARLTEQYHEELQEARRDAHNEIIANAHRLERHMDESVRAVRQEVVNTAAQLQEQIGQVRDDVSRIRGDLDALRNDNDVFFGDAETFCQVAREILDDTVSTYRAELLVPGGRTAEEDILRKAEEQIALAQQHRNNASVARLAANDAYESVLRYRSQVMAAELEWQEHYQAAAQAVNSADAQLEANRSIRIEEVELDVDHWSNGALGEVADDLQALHGALSGDATLQELDDIRAAALDRAEEIEHIAVFANEAIAASEDRFALSADAAQTLYDEFGMHFVEEDGGNAACYQGRDERAAYRIHMKNPATGIEIVITQTPVEENGRLVTRVESDVISYGQVSMAEADNIVRGILHTLGLDDQSQGGVVQTVDGYADKPSDRDCTDQQRWATEATADTVAQPDRRPMPSVGRAGA